MLLLALDVDVLPWSLAAIGVGLIVWCWPKLRGTTLIAPAIWATIALAAMALGEDLLTPGDQSPEVLRESILRYLVGITSFCPAMALFGAKRPQNRAWQFIVLTLWIVLSLPALHAWMFGSGQGFSIHAAQSWFLLILLTMTAANYPPTRFAVSSLIFTIAQLLLLREFLPLATWIPHAADMSLPLAVLALSLVSLGWPKRKTVASPLDRLWLDFRDAFGVVWGLRVQQRVNQSAAMYQWKLRLDWHGFTPFENATISPDIEKAVRDHLSNLLRRFVSPSWIAERLGTPLN